MALLGADDILKADDVKSEIVEVPEWPGKDGKPGLVRVRGGMAWELDEYDESLWVSKVVGDATETERNTQNSKARLVVKLVIDENGKRVFRDDQADALGRKSHAAVNRLFLKIWHLSGRGTAAVKSLEKNSEAARTK